MKTSATFATVFCALLACSSDQQSAETPTSEATSTADIDAPPPTETATATATTTATTTPATSSSAKASTDEGLAGVTYACKKSSDCKGGKQCCGSGDGMLGTQCVAECDWMSQSLACGADADCKKMPTTLFGGTKIKIEGCKPAEKSSAVKFCKFEPAK